MFRKTVVYNPRINPSWLVIGAGTMLYKGVAIMFAVNVATMFAKPGLVGPASFAIIDALAAAARNLVDIGGGEGVRRASNSNKVPYLHTASGYNGHLVADQPLDLVEER